jgi:hypothetical protein
MLRIRSITTLLLFFHTATFESNAFDLQGPSRMTILQNLGYESSVNNRRNLLVDCGLLSVLALTSVPAAVNALPSYSANARNLERVNSGDFSGGSIYDNNPKTEAGKKRRAMIGCKNSIAREEVADLIKSSMVSEKDCNQMVMGGESKFMLQALRNLDCPTCPYGISAERN